MIEFKCRICNNTNNNILHEAREMMFGFKDKFNYVECFNCKCIQILEIPDNISKFYPDEYYSFLPTEIKNKKNRFNLYLNAFKIKLYLNFFPFLQPKTLPYWLNPQWLRPYKLSTKSKILDVGCGSGALLHQLYDFGFSDLTGIDPYIAVEKKTSNFKILKQNLQEVENKFDFIMLNHSFEHMDSPKESISHLSKLLNPRGTIMIRIPVVPCYAWKVYGVDWVQLDAPRHFFIHSIESISILCKSANLKIDSVRFDSTSFQFYGSELYKNNIPLYKSSTRTDLGFINANLEKFYEKAIDLNQNDDGDQACFFLVKNSQ